MRFVAIALGAALASACSSPPRESGPGSGAAPIPEAGRGSAAAPVADAGAAARSVARLGSSPEILARYDIEPTLPPPAPTIRPGGDCKTEYAPRPTRDPNPMCKVDGGTFEMGDPKGDGCGSFTSRSTGAIPIT